MTWNYGTVNDFEEAINAATPETVNIDPIQGVTCWYHDDGRWAILTDNGDAYALYVEGEGRVKTLHQNNEDNAEGLARSHLNDNF